MKLILSICNSCISTEGNTQKRDIFFVFPVSLFSYVGAFPCPMIFAMHFCVRIDHCVHFLYFLWFVFCMFDISFIFVFSRGMDEIDFIWLVWFLSWLSNNNHVHWTSEGQEGIGTKRLSSPSQDIDRRSREVHAKPRHSCRAHIAGRRNGFPASGLAGWWKTM